MSKILTLGGIAGLLIIIAVVAIVQYTIWRNAD